MLGQDSVDTLIAIFRLPAIRVALESFCRPREMLACLARYAFAPDLILESKKSGRTLVFKKGAKGDLSAALERVGRCVEVYERFPGLCSGTMG